MRWTRWLPTPPTQPSRFSSAEGRATRAGRPDEAEPLYREALALGLPDDERAQCTIQLASTVRNLGRPEETLTLLSAEFDSRPESPYAGAAAATRALALATLGRTTEALVVALHGLANTLPRYQRSMHAYADELVTPESQ